MLLTCSLTRTRRSRFLRRPLVTSPALNQYARHSELITFFADCRSIFPTSVRSDFCASRPPQDVLMRIMSCVPSRTRVRCYPRRALAVVGCRRWPGWRGMHCGRTSTRTASDRTTGREAEGHVSADNSAQRSLPSGGRCLRVCGARRTHYACSRACLTRARVARARGDTCRLTGATAAPVRPSFPVCSCRSGEELCA